MTGQKVTPDLIICRGENSLFNKILNFEHGY